ncbi:hypothetical protein AJ79_03254 [Helicocarpus griseus UAMH5409]|uniref:Altered inheritance of mitochondria protein 9, mitochondrial n=1 Tax=Helicocarpus griseus UAMH5409 TaxID=1447875 RepID=A0A2B7Y084_9EURO|nr:hypothetical protein AJ79_03254 [Helicocarpus griseus UAMH5409]
MNFFRYTRSRFLHEEEENLSQRYVKYNVEELANIAAEVAGPGKRHCIQVDKLADGMYNKALLLTMADGTQVVGKVPNANAGLPHFTTASEVATMDFVRNVLGTPVPKVLGWCSKADNPYGGLYYKGDLACPSSLVYTNRDGKRTEDSRFAVGPSVSRNNVHDDRN